MALTGIKKRLYNPGVNNIIGDSDGVLSNLNGRCLLGTDRAKRCLEIYWSGTVEASEIGGAATALKDGTTTPFQFVVVSSDATDIDTAAGHVRKVAVIFVGVQDMNAYIAGRETEDLYIEVIAMNGTTDVTSTYYATRLIHAYACDWGSGDDDAAGAITVEAPANTNLLTIEAAENESTGGILYFPRGRKVKHEYVQMVQYGAPTADKDGAQVTANYNNFDEDGGTDGDFESKVIVVSTDNRVYESKDFDPLPKKSFLDSQISYTLAAITNAPTATFHAIVSC